jgi:Fic family protein
MAEASFIPPSPLQLGDHLGAWQDYLLIDEEDPLVQAAVMHAQFELLHPFKDGNGRIGRLLIPLFLYGKQVIQAPSFYLSAYLESNRDRYYAGLQNISRAGQWTEWVSFFLDAIIDQAKTNIARLRQIIALYDWSKTEVQRVSRSQHSAAIVDTLFSRPVFRANDLADATGMERSSVYPIIRKLEKEGIIEVLALGQGRRSTRYIFAELLNTVEGRKVL